MSLLLLFPTVEGEPGGGETLAAGDLTTAFSAWIANRAPDLNTDIRDTLAAHYSASATSDLSTLLARFLRDRE